MKYFAYGSNMSVTRLRQRVPSAVALGCYSLAGHQLKFHKACEDGSGKCDAFFTGNAEDVIYGALYEICPSEKAALDEAEGLGQGYDIKDVLVLAADGSCIESYTYSATHTNENIKPYSWYVNHVLIGARETQLPDSYITINISVVESIEDNDRSRDEQQRAMHK